MVTTTTCPHCHKSFDAGPLYCPHCFMKIPAVMRPPAPAPSPRPAHGAHEPVVRRVSEREPRKPREAKAKAAAPAGQCPACSHPITAKDEWCKWCHWPVNRKP